MEKNLDPALVAQLLALMQRNTGANNVGAQQWSGQQGTPLDQYTVDRRPDLQMREGTYGESAAYDPTDALKTLIYGTPDKGSWSVQTTPVWDDKGNFVGYSSGDGDNLGLAKFVLSSIAAGYGTEYLNGLEAAGGGADALLAAEGAGGIDGGITAADLAVSDIGVGGLTGTSAATGTAATTAAGMSAADQAAMMAANGMTDAEIATALGAKEASAVGLTGAVTSEAGGSSGLTNSVGDYSNEGRNYPTTTSTQGPGGSPVNSSMTNSGADFSKLLGNANLGTLLGAAAGYADGQDKTQTSSRDPWAPAQPYLKGLLADGALLYDQYKQQPFSQAQQTAYGNYGGLLDSINRNAPGLLSGFGANASGANNYDRSNPRRALTGGSQMDFSKWLPGLLGNFGTGGK